MKKYISVDEAVEIFPFSKGQMRHLLHTRINNGFSICVCKVGKRIIIDYEAMNEWIEKHKEPNKK